MKSASKSYITSKIAFTVTLIVVVLTVLAIWLFGLGEHRTIYENSVLSTTVLSVAFFLFLTIGLYKGVKLKDDVGKFSPKFTFFDMPTMSGGNNIDLDGDGIGEILIAVVLWIVATIVLGILIWLLGAMLWGGIVLFIAMMYWIFFRAVRLVFKNSNRCRGKFAESAFYAIAYTLLYNCWIYGIIFLTHYLI